MKKLTLLIAVLALGLFFVSCNKEGQFNPKNKIDRIYHSGTYKHEVNVLGEWEISETEDQPKYVSEIWNWEGKVLKSISYYNSEGRLDNTENFEYDGKRLVAISREGESDRWVLNYEKGKLSSMEFFEGSNKMISYEITHDKGKISEMKLNFFSSKKAAMAMFPMNALRFFIPAASTENMMMAMAKITEKHTTKDVYTINIKIEWDGKNISKEIFSIGTDTDTYEFTYDQKLNPYYGLFDIGENSSEVVMSKNNVTQYVHRDSDNGYSEQKYTYTYDGNFPSTKYETYSYGADIDRYTYTNTYYYEYK